MELALYPFKTMRITQRHDEGNHIPHWKPFKICSDKPFDEALEDGKRGYFHPFNDFKIEEKLGTQETGFSVRLISCEKLKLPKRRELEYLKLTLTHLNKDDFDKLKVGQIIHKNEEIIREGSSGHATGNHFHITANVGKYYGFKKNSNGKWVFAYQKSLLPPEAFYVDTNKTTIINAKKYIFVGVNYYKGMEGAEVGNINNFLAYNTSGRYYGDYSTEAIKVFQKQEKLKVTGEVNLETFTKMLDKGANL